MESGMGKVALEWAAGLAIRFVMIPGLKRLLVRCAPVDVLNRARLPFVAVDFVDSPDLRKDLVLEHIKGNEKTATSFLQAYWSAVHAGVIECDRPDMEHSGGYFEPWFVALLDRWNEMGQLPYVSAGSSEFIRREDLRRVFKENGIAFPVTWR